MKKILSFAASFLFAFYILNPVVIGQDKADKAVKAIKAEKGIKAEKADKADYKHRQRTFCGEGWSNGDKASFRDLREFTMPATGSLSVDGRKNGGVAVVGENRSDIQVKACVNAWADTDEGARSIASGVKIQQGGTVVAEGSDESGWSVSYQISVPRNTSLDLKAHNGGISIRSVDGLITFETLNGGVNLSDLAGSVKGRTTNGGVKVSLTGRTWNGSGLDVITTNGGVNISVPSGFAGTFETGTSNGGYRSSVPELAVETENKDGWNQQKRVVASMNGGGPTIRVMTTNGGVNIGSSIE